MSNARGFMPLVIKAKGFITQFLSFIYLTYFRCDAIINRENRLNFILPVTQYDFVIVMNEYNPFCFLHMIPAFVFRQAVRAVKGRW